MALNPTVRIFNAETGEELDRAMTTAEKAEFDALVAAREAELASREA